MSMISNLVKELREASDWHYHNTDQDLGMLLDKFADTIEMLSEKAREPKQGEWLFKEITDDYHVIGQCSICKERRRIDNFCPNCGARMKGADDE